MDNIQKFTDEEAVKCLSFYIRNKCENCNVKDLGVCCSSCFIACGLQALDLINRQKAEIEDLREIVFTDRSEAIQNLKAEAVKEFAERLKTYYRSLDKTAGALVEYHIDQIVKEMLEGG